MLDVGFSADTEVVLLLCGRFGGERKEPHAPLSPTEYGELARWLKTREFRPADMLTEAARTVFGELIQARLDRARIEFLLGRGTALALALERWQRAGLWVVSRGDAAYPQRYRQVFKHRAPPLLFGAGEQSLMERGGLAVVGARKASDEALQFTAKVGTRCACEGIAVVSGGARGVDSAAMQAATEAGGMALGVLACDLLKSSMNRLNRTAIQAGQLVLLSPFSPEAGFNAGNAMARNQLIYALADHALVVDSTEDSGGTWAGATEDLRQGWTPLFVRLPDEGGGNPVLASRGAKVFAFDFEADVSLRQFFEVAEQASSEVDCAVPDVTFDVPLDEASHESVTLDNPTRLGAEAERPLEAQTAPALVAHVEEPKIQLQTSVLEPGSSPQLEKLDMYPLFESRLELLIGNSMVTEDEIVAALNLEDKQVKAWLKRALAAGRLSKKMVKSGAGGKGKAHYLISPQVALC